MPTKRTKTLTAAQQRLLEACDGRGILGMRKESGILPIWNDTRRTTQVLLDRGLVRKVSVPKYRRNGITLTQLGADMLVPPGTVTYPE